MQTPSSLYALKELELEREDLVSDTIIYESSHRESPHFPNLMCFVLPLLAVIMQTIFCHYVQSDELWFVIRTDSGVNLCLES